MLHTGTSGSVTHCFPLSVGTLGGELSEVGGRGWKVGVLRSQRSKGDLHQAFTRLINSAFWRSIKKGREKGKKIHGRPKNSGRFPQQCPRERVIEETDNRVFCEKQFIMFLYINQNRLWQGKKTFCEILWRGVLFKLVASSVSLIRTS